MKRMLRIIILLIITAGLAACSPADAGQSCPPESSVASPTAKLSPTLAASPSPSASDPAYL